MNNPQKSINNQKVRIKSKPKLSNKGLLLLFGSMTIIFLVYMYYIRLLCDDEFFNYGFAYNILNGLVPYKDFNMIIPPLFHYLLAFVLKIFGQKLLIYHLVISVMISGITTLSYQKLGKSAFIIPLILLSYPYTGYNIFCVLLLFYLIVKKEGKYSHVIETLLIIMMTLTKQTLAILAIPDLLQSKNKKKTFLIYLISGLVFLLYLVVNNNLFKRELRERIKSNEYERLPEETKEKLTNKQSNGIMDYIKNSPLWNKCQ